VRRFCDRALLLEHGRPVELGDTEHVGNRYLELNFSEQARQLEEAAAEAEADGTQAVRLRSSRGSEATAGESVGEQPSESESEPERFGDGRAEILEAWFEDERGGRAEVLSVGRACVFAARVRFNEQVEDPLFGINLQNSRRDHLLSASNLSGEPHSGTFEPGETVVFRVRFDVLFAPGRYHVTPAVASHSGGWIDRRERMVSTMVTGTSSTDALIDLPYELKIERGAAASASEPVR
jgi:ABC-type glutathione transport system ATPase component